MEQRRQLEIDFSRRGHQLRLLDRVRFGRGMGCSASNLVLVLRGIDSFAGEAGWCFASLQTIAERCNLNERTVRRAIETLVLLYLIRKQVKRGRSGNVECRYQICWANLDAYIEEQQTSPAETTEATDAWTDVDPSEGATDSFAGGNGQFEGGQRTVCPGATDSLSGGNGQFVQGQRTESPLGNGQRVQLTARLTANDPPPNRAGAAADLGSSVGVLDRPDIEAPPDPAWGDQATEVEEILATRVYRGTARRLARLCDAATARDIIVEYDHAIARGHLKSPGAIAARLETGQWPQDRVRTAAEIRASLEAAERRRASERATQAARERESQQAQTAAVDLEARFGAVLDAMPEGERHALAKEVLGDWLYSRWKSGKTMAVCREQLLEAIAVQGLVQNGPKV